MCVLPDEYICDVDKDQVNRISCEDGELILDFSKHSQMMQNFTGIDECLCGGESKKE